MAGQPGEITEWDEIQARLGNRPAIKKPQQKGKVNWEQREKAEHEQHVKELENLVMRNLDELEEEDDEAVLRALREKRMAELKLKALRERFGELRELSEVEYQAEVTDEKDAPVVVLLTKPGVRGCDLLLSRLKGIARRFPATKFVSILSEAAIRDYPDRLLPTVIVYFNGDVRGQIIGLEGFELPEDHLNEADVEWRLVRLKAIEGSRLTKDPREKRADDQRRRRRKDKNTAGSAITGARAVTWNNWIGGPDENRLGDDDDDYSSGNDDNYDDEEDSY